VIVRGKTGSGGNAFCLGLEKLNAISVKQPVQSSASAILTLIKGASFRDNFTLGLHPATADSYPYSVDELLDMYVAHKATRRHDKFYALLGMSSDDISSSSLLPDYRVPWGQLLQRMVHFNLGNEVDVKSCENEEMVGIAGICGNGRILGTILNVTQNPDGSLEIRVARPG
jgi:hypothetical protein